MTTAECPMRGPLVVLVGPPASGKTTWARTHFPSDQIVSLDELRRTVSGDPNNQDATRFAVAAQKAILQGRMRFGLTTVVDATNAEPDVRHELAMMQFIGPPDATAFAPSVAVIFDTPLDVCVARNARRRGTRRVPEQFIRECHAAIERDMPVASTWIPGYFSTGLRVRPDGTYRMGGSLAALRPAPSWMADTKRITDCPDWTGLRKCS